MNKNYCICVDYQSCISSVRKNKPMKCFGPCMIRTWNLYEKEKELLMRWNEINIFSLTSEINRFRALAIILTEVDDSFKSIEDIDYLLSWVETEKELTNTSLETAINETGSICLKQALLWSREVNHCIEQLATVDFFYPNVKECLEYASQNADVTIIADQSPDSIERECMKYGYIPQRVSTKALCMSQLKENGYKSSHILFIGHSRQDFVLARAGIFFYPIIFGKEEESWRSLKNEVLQLFITNQFDGRYTSN